MGEKKAKWMTEIKAPMHTFVMATREKRKKPEKEK